jgi:hypothetical protein
MPIVLAWPWYKTLRHQCKYKVKQKSIRGMMKAMSNQQEIERILPRRVYTSFSYVRLCTIARWETGVDDTPQ